MSKLNLEDYAKKILTDAGCDIHTYGGEWSTHIMDDLKEAFPNGMEYPYIDVANAILAMSRPEPIKRAKWLAVWENDSDNGSTGCDSFEEAKETCKYILSGWMEDEVCSWGLENPTPEKKENWNYMIYNCEVYIEKYNENTDEYEDYYEFDDEELKALGWKEFPEEEIYAE